MPEIETKTARSWSAEEIEQIKKWLTDGKSFAEIGRLRGQGESRNSISGKVHRAGIGPGRPSAPPKPEARVRIPRPVAKAPPAPPPPRVEAEDAPPLEVAPIRVEEGHGPTLATLAGGQCKFPVGHASGADQMFCAAPAMEAGAPYCARHGTPGLVGSAFKPTPTRSDKRDLGRMVGRLDERARSSRPA